MPTVVTIGNFDGVHRGHAQLIARAASICKSSGDHVSVVALAFDPSPAAVLRPGLEPARLTTFVQRERFLRELGVHQVIQLDPRSGMLEQTANEFVSRIVREHKPVAWVAGPDFRFGKNRTGDVVSLGAVSKECGFALHVVEPVAVALTDHTVVPARSTTIRQLLTQGRVTDASAVLGRWHELDGLVVQGDRRGRQLGFPTANITTSCMLPADGVYAAFARLPDGRVFPAAVNVGKRPTFDAPPSLEAHVIFPPTISTSPSAPSAPWKPIDGLPEYHWPIRLSLVAFIRDQVKFAGIDALKAQLQRDIARTLTVTQLADVTPVLLKDLK